MEGSAETQSEVNEKDTQRTSWKLKPQGDNRSDTNHMKGNDTVDIRVQEILDQVGTRNKRIYAHGEGRGRCP